MLRNYPEVPEAFADGVAWIGCSQKPDIDALQRRMYFQLTNKDLTSTRNEPEKQYATIVQAVRGKNVLLCVDE